MNYILSLILLAVIFFDNAQTFFPTDDPRPVSASYLPGLGTYLTLPVHRRPSRQVGKPQDDPGPKCSYVQMKGKRNGFWPKLFLTLRKIFHDHFKIFSTVFSNQRFHLNSFQLYANYDMKTAEKKSIKNLQDTKQMKRFFNDRKRF